MSFFSSIYHSIFDIAWLKKQKDKKKEGWSQFLPFIFLIAVLTVLPAFWTFPTTVKNAQKIFETRIPDFSAEIKNGTLFVSRLEQPYLFEETHGEETPKIIVDTQSTSTKPLDEWIDVGKENGFLVVKDRITFYDRDLKQTESRTFADMPDFSFNKESLVRIVDRLSGPVSYFLPLVFAFFYFVVLLVGRLLSIAFVSLLIFLIARLRKEQWTYSSLFTIGLFAATGPLLFDFLLWSFHRPIPLLSTVFFFFLLLAVVFSNKQEGGENVKK